MPRSLGRPAAQLPEPARLWIRHSPRHWPPPVRPWVDAAAGALGRVALSGDPMEGERLAVSFAPDLAYDDTVYLPPVPAHRAAERAALADDLARAGTPVLFQASSAEEPLPLEPGVTVVADLLPALLAIEPWPEPPAGGGHGALWPLLPGLSDEPAHWLEGLPRLAGFSWVQGMEVQLSGTDRRLLLERAGDSIFDALYHRAEPPAGERERAFAAAVATAGVPGLFPFPPRPLPAGRLAGNRRLAAALLLAGELSSRLGRSPVEGQAYFRAARFVDTTSYDVAALAAERNLGVIPALDEGSRRLLRELLEAGASSELAALEEDYLALRPEE